jgi:hypothetical protein
LLCVYTDAQQPTADEEARFITAFRTAFEAQDVDALLALVCWDGTPEAHRVGLARAFSSLVKEKLVSVTLEPPSIAVEPEVTHGGFIYRMNIPAVRTLRYKTTDANAGQPSETSHQVGVKDGRLLIAQYAPLPEGRTSAHERNEKTPPLEQSAPAITP